LNFSRPGLAPAWKSATSGRPKGRPYSLGDVVGAFKSISAIGVNRILTRLGSLWQEDYYEHVIRDVQELEQIRDYISTNPAQWLEDPENPDRPSDI
jgi:putative transposase